MEMIWGLPHWIVWMIKDRIYGKRRKKDWHKVPIKCYSSLWQQAVPLDLTFQKRITLACSHSFPLHCELHEDHQALPGIRIVSKGTRQGIHIEHWPKGKHLNGFLLKSQYGSHCQGREAFGVLQFGHLDSCYLHLQSVTLFADSLPAIVYLLTPKTHTPFVTYCKDGNIYPGSPSPLHLAWPCHLGLPWSTFQSTHFVSPTHIFFFPHFSPAFFHINNYDYKVHSETRHFWESTISPTFLLNICFV